MPRTFFHGSPRPLQIGTILKPRKEHMVNPAVDEVLEKYRPRNIPLPRHQGVFLVDDLEDGYNHWGENEHIYMVRPLGQIYGPFHVGWVNAMDHYMQTGEEEDISTEAESYWDGAEFGEDGWEYYTQAAEVVKYLGQTHQLWESEINDIRKRAGLPLKEQQNIVTLYHGTDLWNLDSIEKKGLKNPFMTTNPQGAYEWSKAYGTQDVCILEVIVDTARLIPDLNQDDEEIVFSQLGMEHHDIRDGDLIMYLKLIRRYGIPWNSVQDAYGGYAAVYVGTIPPKQIEKYDCEDEQ